MRLAGVFAVDRGGGAEVGGLVAQGGAEVGIDDDLGIGLGGVAGTEAFGSAGKQRRFTTEVTEFREIGKEPEESTGMGNVELPELLKSEAGYHDPW